MEKKKLVWIGIRESEIAEAKELFFASITIFGSSRGNNYSFDKISSRRINYGKENEEWYHFASQTAQMLIEKYTDIEFMGYYPAEMAEISKQIKEHAICINDSIITDILENKLYTKLWVSSFVPTIPFSTFIDTELSYISFCNAFPECRQFVLQGTFSCGGSGTWLIRSDEDLTQFTSEPDEDHIVMVTPYFENSISVNTHLIVYSNTVQYFPPSIQIIEHFEHRLCYDGGDFVAAKKMSKHLLEKIQQYSEKIGMRLSLIGYRGVCGIDFLVVGEKIYFMEINARFQSSTFLLNRSLKKNNLPTLQEMNISAFYHNVIPEIPLSFEVLESFLGINYTKDTFTRAEYLWKRSFQCPEVTSVIDDEITWTSQMEFDTYLYKLVFGINITCIAPEGKLRLHNNFDLAWGLNENIHWSKQAKRFKTAILNQGVHLSETCLQELEKDGGPNYEMFFALDLIIEDTICINAPYMVAFSELSPFEIDFINKAYMLKYYNKVIARVSIRTVDINANRTTQSGIPYYEICYMGIDRLRIHARSGCYFKDKQIGCHFCGIEGESAFSIIDIKEVLETYKNTSEIRHFLVGGGSFNPSDDFQKIIQIVGCIRETFNHNIYLMSIPPVDTDILFKLKEAGVTEVAFNLEIYDRARAKKIMPGKGNIPFERYDTAFQTAVKIWGKSGNVRSALIVGLEPKESTIQGIEYLCSIGVSPILTLFKPDENMEDYLAPNSDEVLYIWETAENICRQYHVPLGPSCHYCEDNVLKVTMNE